ncbi:hypothetical protein ACWPKS_12295 [Coraliomargarita sp. W4R72]
MKNKILSILFLCVATASAEPASGDLKRTFFFRGIANFTTNSYFVEAEIFDKEKNQFEKRFIIAQRLVDAIIQENEFDEGEGGFPSAGWKEAVNFALKQRGQGFVFHKEESQELVEQIFSSSSLQKCRQNVSEAGLENVLFYLSGLGRGGTEEAIKWFRGKDIQTSDLGPLTQVLYENGYFPYESNGWLSYLTKRQYEESLGKHFTFMLSLGVLDSQTPIVEPIAAGQRR